MDKLCCNRSFNLILCYKESVLTILLISLVMFINIYSLIINN